MSVAILAQVWGARLIAHNSCMDAGLREEVLKKYSDMLRVGELWLNDGLLKWSSTSEVAPEIALDELYRVFERSVGDTPSVNAGVLLYLVCKSTSMDYILLHVLQFLREHIQSDMVPTITGSFGYHVGVAKTSCRVELRFSDRDNLVVIGLDEREVVGTFKAAQTSFSLPPLEEKNSAVYYLDMELASTWLEALPQECHAEHALYRRTTSDLDAFGELPKLRYRSDDRHSSMDDVRDEAAVSILPPTLVRTDTVATRQSQCSHLTADRAENAAGASRSATHTLELSLTESMRTATGRISGASTPLMVAKDERRDNDQTPFRFLVEYRDVDDPGDRFRET